MVAPVFADRVQETSTTTGTVTYALTGASTNMRTFIAGAGSGVQVPYVAIDSTGAGWEIGLGTTGTGTLTRDTILASSNAGAAVSWAAGTRTISLDLPSAYVLAAKQGIATALRETVSSPTISAGALTLDLTAASVFNVALNANVTSLTLSGAPTTGTAFSFTARLSISGAYAITWPSSVKWPLGVAPILSSTSGKMDVIVFETTDGGTTYQAFVAGQGL